MSSLPPESRAFPSAPRIANKCKPSDNLCRFAAGSLLDSSHMGQLDIAFPSTWGGARRGAGRKRSRASGDPHLRRKPLSRHHPVHLTLRYRKGLPSMRSEVLARRVMAQIRRANRRFWRIVHFSIQSTHLHLLVEVESVAELARAMKGLGVRMARAVNAVLGRRGAVSSGRYHVHALRTPRETRHAIAYVLCNAKKHGALRGGWDRWSSAAWFDGWSTPLGRLVNEYRQQVPLPVAAPRTWLLAVGWRKHGPVHNESEHGAVLSP